MMKLSLMRTATGKEDPELSLRQRTSSLELPASEIATQINASQSLSNRHISTSTVQRRLQESGLHGQIAAKKPLLNDTNNKKRLAWAKKHEQWTLDRWKSVSDLFRIQGTLNQHGYHSILQRYTIPSGLRLVGQIGRAHV